MHDLKLYNLTYPFYKHADREKIEKASKPKLDPIVKWLGDKKYLIGDKICYLDFILFEVCNVMDFLTKGRIWNDYPSLKKYAGRIKSLPALQKAIAAAESKPFNNPFAKINHQLKYM